MGAIVASGWVIYVTAQWGWLFCGDVYGDMQDDMQQNHTYTELQQDLAGENWDEAGRAFSMLVMHIYSWLLGFCLVMSDFGVQCFLSVSARLS